MEPTVHPELNLGPDHHYAKLLLVAVLAAAPVAGLALALLAAAQPA